MKTPSYAKLIDSALKVEGIARHGSTHAAGVVISKEPLNKYVPLQRVSKGSGEGGAMVQIPDGGCGQNRFAEMDFLGLVNLNILGQKPNRSSKSGITSISICIRSRSTTRRPISCWHRDTAGVFQLEGSGMRRYIRELRPSTFPEIAAIVALYRPGPMEQIPTYIKAKHGLEPIKYPHPVLSPLPGGNLRRDRLPGAGAFYCQRVRRVQPGKADIFRKAMGKKIAAVIQKEKPFLSPGANAKGFSSELAEQVYSLIEPFADTRLIKRTRSAMP